MQIVTPLFIFDFFIPSKGLPAIGDKNEWKEYRKEYSKLVKKNQEIFNKYLISRNVRPLQSIFYLNLSPYLNIYGYPLELDYLDLRPLPLKWARFDNLKRIEESMDYDIPEELKDKPGKLIYLSMGSMGGMDVKLMKRLVAILAKSKHRFIVSKGPFHDKYELADNMWGQQIVPQIQVLSVVDLVITHGGNNTVTETFTYGKPMIVMPLFYDQYDNAQRIDEKGFGIRLDPRLCTEQELLESIEKLLNDKELNDKLKNISNRIQSENSISKLPNLIESLVNNKEF